jgi:hypothetical protein
MQEFFFTIITIWAIWKIIGAFSNSSQKASPQYQQTNHHHYYQKKEQEKVRVEQKEKPEPRIPNSEGEYVDYEEIK